MLKRLNVQCMLYPGDMSFQGASGGYDTGEVVFIYISVLKWDPFTATMAMRSSLTALLTGKSVKKTIGITGGMSLR